MVEEDDKEVAENSEAKSRDTPDEKDSVEYYFERIFRFFEKNVRKVFAAPP